MRGPGTSREVTLRARATLLSSGVLLFSLFSSSSPSAAPARSHRDVHLLIIRRSGKSIGLHSRPLRARHTTCLTLSGITNYLTILVDPPGLPNAQDPVRPGPRLSVTLPYGSARDDHFAFFHSLASDYAHGLSCNLESYI